MIGSWAATLVLFSVYGPIEDQWKERKQQSLMDRVSTEFERGN
jgi:hypothetical protein